MDLFVFLVQPQMVKMEAKKILVTGATDGIGKQTARELAIMGHEVFLHGRSMEKSVATCHSLEQELGKLKLHAVAADLCDFHEIRKMAASLDAQLGHLDVLINNAGVFDTEKVILPNGFERTFMVNYLAPFDLTMHLLGLLKAAPSARIVNVSSMAQSGSIDFDNLNGEKYWDAYNAYAVSKLENVLFTYKLDRILKDEPITVNCLHPGVVSTKLLHAGWGMGGVDLHQGAQNSIYAAVSPEMEGVSGKYLVNKKDVRSAAISYDKRVQDRLWDISLQLVKLSQK
jgi:NAD(P)-dependent dehydrogenase (short-subunit alcohol dehydrogenase family)